MNAQDTDDDPMPAMLASLPIDDEPVTDKDRRHIDAGWRAYREGEVVSAEDVMHVYLDSETIAVARYRIGWQVKF
jgi:hypothetical protein